MLHRHKRGTQRFIDRAAMQAQECSRWRQRHHVQFKFHTKKKRAFRAGKQLAHIERLRASRLKAGCLQQRIERIAGIATRDLRPREGVADLLPDCCVAEQVANGSVNPRFRRVAAIAFSNKLRRRERTKCHLRTVC